MLYQVSSLVALSSLVVAQTGPAPIITDNQYGIEYSLRLNQGPGPLNGEFDFKAISKGVLVGFNINGFNLSDDTTYTYHIHEYPVPANGSCNATGEHFDPYHVGASYKCDPSQPDLCQLGDLSGEHGAIVVNASHPTFATGYTDDFLSTTPGNIAFFGNRSIVVHRKRDGYRLQCGNFELIHGPMFANGSTQTAGHMPTTSCDDATSAHMSASTALSDTAVSMSSNATSTVDAATISTSSSSTHYSSSPKGTASSTMSLQTGNHGSGRVEASLIMLGLTAVVPVVFL